MRLSDSTDRAALQARLKEQGIPTMIYYPKPMHSQGAFVNTYSANADCSMTEQLCKTVLSLPMGPYLDSRNNKVIVEMMAI